MSLITMMLSGTDGMLDAAVKRGIPVAAITTLLKHRPDLAPLVDALLVATLMGVSNEQQQMNAQLQSLGHNQELTFKLIEQLAEALDGKQVPSTVRAEVNGSNLDAPPRVADQVRDTMRKSAMPVVQQVVVHVPRKSGWPKVTRAVCGILNDMSTSLQASTQRQLAEVENKKKRCQAALEVSFLQFLKVKLFT